MKHAPGRNQPCPCRSGRKYKHCCLRKAGAAAGPAYSRHERTEAFDKIGRFVMRDEFQEDRRVAQSLFWAGRLDFAPEARRRELESDELSLAAFLNWLVFDLDLNLLRDEARGTIADRFLAARGDGLTVGERLLVDRMRRSCQRLYEVSEVRLDEALTLRDLWTGESIQVSERLATHQLARWDLLGARVIEGAEGRPVIEGTPYLYPVVAKAAIMAEFRRHHARVTKELGSDDPVLFFKRVGMLFHHVWLDHVALRPMPTMLTAEGDPIELGKTVFDVTDQERVAERLAGHVQLHRQDDGSYVWLEESAQLSRSLGTLVLTPGRLALETMSRARAERGRRFIEELAGEVVRFRMTRYEDLEEALARAPAHAPKGSGLPPEVEREVVTQFYEKHYRAWVDEPVPALGGRTPRHAARLKTVRPRVVDLIKGLENHMERERQAGRPAYDVTWMWAELGLDRP